MKRPLKSALRALWRATWPLRRPIRRKLDDYAQRLVHQAIRMTVDQMTHQVVHRGIGEQLLPVLHRLEGAVGASTHATNVLAYDMNLVLNSLVREVARLQMQVEVLQQVVQGLGEPQAGLSVVGEPGAGDDFAADHADRMRAG